jgi:uncharacterized membrane protein YphA (DoxX/SURF4 family)
MLFYISDSWVLYPQPIANQKAPERAWSQAASLLVEVLCAAALVFVLFTPWVSILRALLMLVDVLFIYLPISFPLQDN